MDGQPQMPHKLTLSERKQFTVTGVSEVISFDETAVVLQTGLGTLVIQGRELKLKTLSPEGGLVRVDGEITAMIYEEPRQRGGWAGRLFR